LQVGELSEPSAVRVGEKKEAYRILKLVSRSEPHFADITTDYSKIQQAAESEKRQQLLFDWVKKKRKQFYIRLDPVFNTCDFAQKWNINQTN
jgi:peptidyl-prolyl cis-trans isomerase SurA